MSILEIILAIGVVTFIIYTVFQIVYLLELRRTSRTLRIFIENIDKSIQPSLEELGSAVKNLRQTTENATAISRNLRDATDIAAILAGVWAAVKAGFAALAKKKDGEKEIPPV
jgi:hypothetical protein